MKKIFLLSWLALVCCGSAFSKIRTNKISVITGYQILKLTFDSSVGASYISHRFFIQVDLETEPFDLVPTSQVLEMKNSFTKKIVSSVTHYNESKPDSLAFFCYEMIVDTSFMEKNYLKSDCLFKDKNGVLYLIEKLKCYALVINKIKKKDLKKLEYIKSCEDLFQPPMISILKIIETAEASNDDIHKLGFTKYQGNRIRFFICN